PHEKKYDDVYVVTADVVDLAGNEASEEITFSVNRFGSVYVIDDATQKVIDDYYTNEAPWIYITEINIDELQWRDVSAIRDGDIRNLKPGKDYTVLESEDAMSWNSFTYKIKPDNFSRDGKYSVIISSKDAAANEQDNAAKDREIEFAVDTTKPGIAVSGFEDNGVYTEESHKISFNITDNMGVSGAAVYDDDRLVKEYTEEELERDGYTEQIELPSQKKRRNIRIVSTDVAGNEGEAKFENIVIYPEALEEEPDEAGTQSEVLGEKREEGSPEDKEEAIPRKKEMPVLPVAAGTAGILLGGYAVFEFLIKKKIK
ncbi:MAG: hypothetical protein J6U50_04450, partial [Lachnospiraceae bacterium]|nr:hypothetical protein [Lachnospiraceae bacterium]